jgi:putative Mg2+ transporter-C (MgtC) family protein
MSEPEALLRLVLAALFGGLIGLDREAQHKPAGVRTFAIVAVGSALFTLVGILAFGEGDPGARIAAQIVTGVGFLGAGTILHHRGAVRGLTTAAGIWGAAAVGMGFGAGLYILSIGGSLLMLAIFRIFGLFLHEGGSAEAEPPEDSGTAQGQRDSAGGQEDQA